MLQCGVGGFASAGAAYAYWNCPRWNKDKVTLMITIAKHNYNTEIG